MDRDRFLRAGVLFERAVELSAEERKGFLDEECGDDRALRREVDELLAQDELRDLDAVVEVSTADLLGEGGRQLPERIAGYDVREILGQGGMAIVYRAEQEHPRRSVALKVIRSGPRSGALLRRFAHEAEVLALLGHPGIAQVYEAGTEETPAGPLPWLAMELIDGSSLLEYVRARNLGPPECVRLLIEICDAVQHAHQKGVIHRDLKPGNVMVDREGRAKVLDFGIARVTGGDVAIATRQTQMGELIGTLPYMSPEQTRGDPAAIDTRTDVYSLGALAYEILSGTKPIEIELHSIPESLRRIEEVDPIPLGRIDKALSGDLETIIAKALAKERERRYSSAAELAADLRRYLADEPILARPPTTVGQLRRFARKNRTLVGGVLATFVALAAGIVTTSLQFVRAREQSARAQSESQTARAVTSFLGQMYQQIPASPAGDILLATDILEHEATRAETQFSSQPAVLAEILNWIGGTYLESGRMIPAGQHLKRSVEVWEQIASSESFQPRAWKAYYDLGNYHFQMYESAAAEQVLERVLEHGRPNEAELSLPYLASVLELLGSVRYDLGRAEEGHRALQESLELLKGNPADPLYRQVESDLAANRGDLEQQESSLRQLVDHLGEASTTQARKRVDLAVLLLGRARTAGEPDRTELLQEAEALCRETLAFQLGVGERYPRLGHTYHNLSVILFDQGRKEEAIELCRKAVELRREYFGPDHPDLAASLRVVATQLSRIGQSEASIAPLEEAHAIYARKAFERERVESAWTLAQALQALEELDAAVPYFEEVLAFHRGDGGDRGVLASCLVAFAACEQERLQPDRAESLLRECLELYREDYAPTDWRVASVEGQLGYAVLLQGRVEEARPMLERAHASLERELDPHNTRLAISRSHLNELREVLGESATAAPIEASDPGDR